MEKNKIKINKEEKDILSSFEKGEWKSVRNKKALAHEAKIAAETYLKKDARINIRLSSFDLDLIK